MTNTELKELIEDCCNEIANKIEPLANVKSRLYESLKPAINYTRCCTELKDKEEMNFVEYAKSEGYTYNNENHYFYKGGINHLFSNVRDKYIKEVIMLIDITKHL